MPAVLGTWATLTQGSDPDNVSVANIDAGSNRKFVLAVVGENNTSPTVTVTIGGVAPSESLEYDLTVTGTADLFIRTYIWNEVAIASMSAADISWSDGVVWSKISWSYITITGTDQGTSVYDDAGNEDTQSITITWPSSTDSNGPILVMGASDSANRPISFDTGITNRESYSLADYASAFGDGTGGGGLASSMVITNDEVANSAIIGLGIFFAEASSTAAYAMYHYRNHGTI